MHGLQWWRAQSSLPSPGTALSRELTASMQTLRASSACANLTSMLSSRIVQGFPAQKHSLGEEMIHFEGVWSAGTPSDAPSLSLASSRAGAGGSLSCHPRGNDVWRGVDEWGICENSDELLHAFQKSVQCYPEPPCMSPQQEKPWSVGGCSLCHRNPISSFSQEPMLWEV